ncbi:hypothetical protein J7E88_21505 [Streptomyces sp. ISL-10]|uniref:hypothetical protein n=1 Tax=Streptomyces sp. ISL-10 TaxID=2819172 RepID=UPI001BEAA16E|nr:hypothetical protein [Streptomyces sp. ISL-10]MBT2367815.1 hypothetical protein [Streptomyces sp. ISL-10]
MISAALSPAAVACALRRTVAGSRALRVLLLLAALMTLGLLWGGQAHAAEVPVEVRAEAEAGTGVRPGVEGPSGADDAVASLPPAQDTAGHTAVREVRRAAEETVDGVRQAVRAVVETGQELTGALGRALPPAPGELPEVPGGGSFPGGPAAKQSMTDAEPFALRSGNLDATADALADAAHPGRSAADGRFGTVDGYDGVARTGQSPDVPAADAAGTDPAPEPFGPCGSVPGAVQHSGENHTPRPGDQHTAAFADGARDALVSAPGCPAAEPPTRDRPRDIPEFPG